MSIDQFFNDGFLFFDRNRKIDISEHELFGGSITFSDKLFDQVMEPIYIQATASVTLDSEKIDVLSILDEIMSEESTNTVQKNHVLSDINIEGFKQIKDLKLRIFTNKKITSINIIAIPIELVFEYKERVDDYVPLIKSNLSYLCSEIMLEEDENLTLDAIELKKALSRYFVKA